MSKSGQKRVTIEAFLHGAQPDALAPVTFLGELDGKVILEKDTNRACIVYKHFLSDDEVQKVLDWAENAHLHADSGKIVVLIDYQPPVVAEWHDPEQQSQHWREELGSDAEGMAIWFGRFEHLLHMG